MSIASIADNLPQFINLRARNLTCDTKISCLGTMDVKSGLTFSDGAGDGKVLSSDADGKASWESVHDVINIPAKRVAVTDADSVLTGLTLTAGQLMGGGASGVPTAINTATGNGAQVNFDGANTLTFTMTQDLKSTATPTFSAITANTLTATSESLTATTNQLRLGSSPGIATINSTMTGNRTITLPDPLSDAKIVLTEGKQIVNGQTTFTDIVFGGVSGDVTVHDLTSTGTAAFNSVTNTNITNDNKLANLTLTNANTRLAFNTGDVNTATYIAMEPGSSGGPTITVPNETFLGGDPAGAFFVISNSNNGAQEIKGGLNVDQLTLSGTANQLSFFHGAGALNITTPNPIPGLTFTLPDVKSNANFIMSEGAQNINGVKTLSDEVKLSNVSGGTITSTSGTVTSSLVFPVSADDPELGNKVYNLPNIDGAASGSAVNILCSDVAGSVGLQQIWGLKVGPAPVICNGATSQLQFWPNIRKVIVTCFEPAADRTYYMEDPLANNSYFLISSRNTATQLTSINTDVTSNGSSCLITTFSATTLPQAYDDFKFINSLISSTRQISISINGYAGTGIPYATILSKAAGSCMIRLYNTADTMVGASLNAPVNIQIQLF